MVKKKGKTVQKKTAKVKVKKKLLNKKVVKKKVKVKKKLLNKKVAKKKKTKSEKIIRKISKKSKLVSKKREKKVKIKESLAPKRDSHKAYQEIEQMLIKHRAELLKLISRSASRGKDISKLEHGNYEDMAASNLEREMTFAMGSREREEYFMINSALRKIAIGDYGKCESCSKKINIKRLKIVPFSQYCMECKQAVEHEME